MFKSLCEKNIITPLDKYLAISLGRLAHENKASVLCAIALVNRAISQGHSCLDINKFYMEEKDKLFLELPSLEKWLYEISESVLVKKNNSPLVLDSSKRLYLKRYWNYEEYLAQEFSKRIYEKNFDIDMKIFQKEWDTLFGQDNQKQKLAVITSILRPLSVISGGPGTGKTSIIAKILILFINHHINLYKTIPHIKLLAPTGKAASRLTQSIQEIFKNKIRLSDEVKKNISFQASTIHRALGSFKKNKGAFYYNYTRKLLVDYVIIDESSMIDLALMFHLMQAIPENARIILVGDKDQLASVEAGVVFADLCEFAKRKKSLKVKKFIEKQMPELQESSISVEGDFMVCLEENYRYSKNSGIAKLAESILKNSSDDALTLLRSEKYPDISLKEISDTSFDKEILDDIIRKGYKNYLKEEDPKQALLSFKKFRVLCARRHGNDGVLFLNQYIEKILEESGFINTYDRYYEKRPILIMGNDYNLEIFNGDVGIIFRKEKDFLYILNEENKIQKYLLSQIPKHETNFAMSIHKSQGSEYQEVVIFLPPKESPLLSRELLYTAITRARNKVTIYANEYTIRKSINTHVERYSGILDKIENKKLCL